MTEHEQFPHNMTWYESSVCSATFHVNIQHTQLPQSTRKILLHCQRSLYYL